jgi:hypothetical protein
VKPNLNAPVGLPMFHLIDQQTDDLRVSLIAQLVFGGSLFKQPLSFENVLCFRARVHSLHSKVRDAEVQQGQQGQDRQGQLGGLLSLLSERAERGDQVRGKTPILHANRPASGNLNTGCDFEARLLPIDLNMGKVGLGDAKFCCKLGDAYLLSFAVFSEGVTCADGHAILYDHFHLHVKQHDE